MNSIKLPESFQKLDTDEIYILVDEYVRLNQKRISSRQKRLWYKEYRVPTLFMTLVKKSGFEFPEYSEPRIRNWKCPYVEYLKDLYSRYDLIEKKKKELLRKEERRKKIINKNIVITIYKCSNVECVHNNERTCSTKPVQPRKLDEIINDCNRFREKGFKFKTWNDVLDISPEP